jgi:hypothetical protein
MSFDRQYPTGREPDKAPESADIRNADDPAIEEVSIVVSRISSDDSAEIVQALKALPCLREVVEPAPS